MASLLNSVMSMGKAALEKMAAPADPNQVKVVNAAELAPTPIVEREGCMLLYGPKAPSGLQGVRSMKGGGDTIPTYEIVVHSEKYRHQNLSIYRSTDLADAKLRFGSYQKCVALVLQLDETLCTAPQLQLLCDSCRQNPSGFTALHLAVELNLQSVITREELQKHLNDTDGHGVTPLMLAIKKENLWMTKYLMSKEPHTGAHDFKKNTIYHYAANTNKEIIDTVCEQLEEKTVAAKYSKNGKEGEDRAMLVPPTAKILSQPNDEGNTPLHIACHNDKPDCVHALL